MSESKLTITIKRHLVAKNPKCIGSNHLLVLVGYSQLKALFFKRRKRKLKETEIEKEEDEEEVKQFENVQTEGEPLR